MIDGKSPLAVFIHGNPDGISVPHYVLIDKEGKVAAINAKRPSDPELRADLLKLTSIKAN